MTERDPTDPGEIGTEPSAAWGRHPRETITLYVWQVMFIAGASGAFGWFIGLVFG